MIQKCSRRETEKIRSVPERNRGVPKKFWRRSREGRSGEDQEEFLRRFTEVLEEISERTSY